MFVQLLGKGLTAPCRENRHALYREAGSSPQNDILQPHALSHYCNVLKVPVKRLIVKKHKMFLPKREWLSSLCKNTAYLTIQS